MMAKLCKMAKKDLDKNFDEYVSMIDKARFVCEKCGRASNKKSYVCKPKSITG
jgi:hypothetical protein